MKVAYKQRIAIQTLACIISKSLNDNRNNKFLRRKFDLLLLTGSAIQNIQLSEKGKLTTQS